MRIFRHYENLPPEARGAAVTIGNFDGVHRGHQAVIGEAGRVAKRLDLPLGVLTFEPHPRSVFQPDAPPFRLTSLRTKAHDLEALGVDCLYVLHFDLEFSKRTAQAFVADILVGGLEVRHVVVGDDFVFGHARRGNVEVLGRMAAEQGFGLTCVAPVTAAAGAGKVFSSGAIRDLLRQGDPRAAARRLGRFWELEGRVEEGNRRGKGLGFPTANLGLGEYLRPATGIYAVRAGLDQGRDTVWRDGVASLGRRPTFGGRELLLEVHLFDFSADLYGRHLRVAMIEFLREERKFDRADALIAQMREDAERAREVLAEVDAAHAMENSAAA
ncbi:MAG: bifunctional riboflavin kinase/FAD synthetase, partial [Alphaproteobacteria bacterium]